MLTVKELKSLIDGLPEDALVVLGCPNLQSRADHAEAALCDLILAGKQQVYFDKWQVVSVLSVPASEADCFLRVRGIAIS